MNVNSSRHEYRRRFVIRRQQLYDNNNSPTNQRYYMVEVHTGRTLSTFSEYDNCHEEPTTSKWSIVRQRLPDILALSKTYKPTSVRAQLALLVALMNRQSNLLRQSIHQDFNYESSYSSQRIYLTMDGEDRMIYLKRIPPHQMIHVDIEGLSFSIPTRQFIIAISRGDAFEAASKFCPPAITEMLIDMSKSKVVDDGLQYQRTLFKMRVGKILFFGLFAVIIGMILILVIGATSSVFNLNLLTPTTSNVTPSTFSSNTETDEYWKWD